MYELTGNQAVKKSRDVLLNILCIHTSGLPVDRLNLPEPYTLKLHQMVISMLFKAKGCNVNLVQNIIISQIMHNHTIVCLDIYFKNYLTSFSMWFINHLVLSDNFYHLNLATAI